MVRGTGLNESLSTASTLCLYVGYPEPLGRGVMVRGQDIEGMTDKCSVGPEARSTSRLTVVESADFALERAFRMADPFDPATSDVLHKAARQYADRADARHEPLARQISEMTRIARRAGIEPAKSDDRLVKALAWCAERHAERTAEELRRSSRAVA
jgi:hypothetical protein